MDDLTKQNEVKTLDTSGESDSICICQQFLLVHNPFKMLEKVKTLMYLRHVCHTAATMKTKL